MSALYGSIQGERGEAAKTGNHEMTAHIRGWHIGVRVEARHDEAGDSFAVYTTGGSNGSTSVKLVGSIKAVNGVPTFEAYK